MSPIPKTAPFADDEIEVLNRVVGPATAVQRAWLAGFLAGLDASGGQQQQAAAPPQAAEPLTILYATESGNSEKLAGDVAKSARKLGFKPSLVDMADLELASLAKVKKLVVIAATWGEGEPPARAIRAYKELMSDAAPRLDGTEFGVLALGDTAYAEFCAIGKALDERFAALGGKRVADRIDCDLDFTEPAAAWIAGTLKTLAPEISDTKVIAIDFGGKTAPNLDVVEAEVTEIINLNSSRSGKETYHLELTFDGAAPAYKPGNSLDLYAENDPAYVDALLMAAHVSDAALRAEFIKSRDVTTLSLKSDRSLCGLRPTLPQGIARRRHGKKLDRRSSVDRSGAGIPRDTRCGEIARIDPATRTARLFDRIIALRSWRGSTSAHLGGALSNTQPRPEGCGVELRRRALKKGAKVRVKLKPNKHFTLPASDRDIIMVGPGTGVAPFRAFVQERRAADAKGRSWLFFGDRTFTHDFLYQTEWQDALKDGALTRMDVAFSRDTSRKGLRPEPHLGETSRSDRMARRWCDASTFAAT